MKGLFFSFVLLAVAGLGEASPHRHRPWRKPCSTTAAAAAAKSSTAAALSQTHYYPASPSPLLSTSDTIGSPSSSATSSPSALPSSNSTTNPGTDVPGCGPAELITSVNGVGIDAIYGTQGSRFEFYYIAEDDVAGCCQRCVDTDGCAASASDLAAGNCILWFSEPACGLVFAYDGDRGRAPDSALVVSVGCGRIEPAGEA